MMYEDFYGLKEKPFNLTPDPRFLYLSRKHREALEHLTYGIDQKEGFILITGEIGTGKTILCRALLNRLSEEVTVALLFNPFFSEKELLRAILTDFGVTPSETTRQGLLEELNQFLLRQASSGKVSVLIIDEAQNVSLQALEQIRSLSNLETETNKLLQIVLVGQAELREKLKLPKLLQLDQRISVRYHLQALNRNEIPKYIYHRLAVADSGGSIFFSRMALSKIARFSRGIPRLINLICDRALLNGYSKQKYSITTGLVVQAAKSLQDEKKPITIPVIFTGARLGKAFAVIVLFFSLIFYSIFHDEITGTLKSLFSIKEPQIEKVSKAIQNPSLNASVDILKAEVYKLDRDFPYTIQIASFRTREKALEEIDALKHLDHPVYISKANIPEMGVWYRVLIGKFNTQAQARKIQKEFKIKGFSDARVMESIPKERRKAE